MHAAFLGRCAGAAALSLTLLVPVDRRARFSTGPQPRGPSLRSRRRTSRRPRWTTRSTSRSPSTTPTSRSCATSGRSILPAGRSTSASMDVAATINPTTVHLRSLTRAVARARPRAELRVRPARARTGCCGSTSGATSRSCATAPRTARRVTEEVKARLLAYNNGAGLADRQRDRHRAARSTNSASPSCPRTSTAGRRSSGRSTTAARRATASRPRTSRAAWPGTPTTCSPSARDDKPADLDGWVTLTNNERHVVPERHAAAHRGRPAPRVGRIRAARADMALRKDGRGADARRRRSRGRPSPIPPLHAPAAHDACNDERDQADLAAERHGASPSRSASSSTASSSTTATAQHPGSPLKDDVRVFYRFRNDETSGLGMPMPAGIVRVYQADSSGGVQFAGEDRIDHTPKDETINLYIGQRVRRRVRAQADRLQEASPTTSTRWRSRSRCATTRTRRSPSR